MYKRTKYKINQNIIIQKTFTKRTQYRINKNNIEKIVERT